jgi:hypothetical protein
MSGQRNQECLFESMFKVETPITTTKVVANVFDACKNPESDSSTNTTTATPTPEQPCESLVLTSISKKASIKDKTTVSKRKAITKKVSKAVTPAVVSQKS